MGMERTNEIEETASEWLIRRDSGRWDASEQARFEQWLDASTEHRVAFLRLEHAWDVSNRLKALGAGIPGDLPPPPGQWNTSSTFFLRRPLNTPEAANEADARSPRRRVYAAAASVVLALVVGVSWYLSAPGGVPYSTPIGGLAKLPIEDGSRITLNTDSQLEVALSKAQRHIALDRGEAFFEVAKDPERPFVVEAGGRRIIAVGTQFSVRREGDTVEVVVTEGKVRVEGGAPKSARGTKSAPVFLVAGYIAQSNDAGLLVRHASLEEAESRLSWRSGVLTFRDQPLGDAVKEFNRYSTRKIIIEDPSVAALRVEGNFRTTQAQAFVRLLEAGFPVRASVDGADIVLQSK